MKVGGVDGVRSAMISDLGVIGGRYGSSDGNGSSDEGKNGSSDEGKCAV